ncbi:MULTISPECIES: NAD(P)/FAD-dependent oxidoreductase [unclassified Mesorhizobium]|uniref:flavin-containing monooxygenase n=1 Tax=unclassified Mesorhizobium TaxID=325217 RepID=UPI00112BBE69|nr:MULTISPECIES: NAD(P)/FAD-dependent oxidoreductase [unclassified Mesorhizobium]MBZ9893405.1 NAD(P)/FAD-dependent oxidoreductase [Mesorhizobium sp. BR1-1-6]TPL19406.1 NAD(P)/FAD-dependent oxidoreductase [Mesorhizobium sp. B2-4-10]TPM10506.1 NAD(P)/FAD-dependent oxidoreductase [Mesorhizobium sp. B2-3-8]TPM15038.1 NAD(P)/FAD-dependent oxidoreductase [Mesorhizobium sp. B2-3-6]TPM20477.1 NAD(P)/FAD-dependent oxidoreductase [Mesorhizobium sp. B2-3-7]
MADTTIRPAAHQTVTIEPAIVIGAGAAGLAAAQALVKAGVATAILEKESRLAEPWHRRHQQLRLNTHRDLSALPGLAYPKGTLAFPHRTAVIRYLNDFSEANRLPVELGVAVEAVLFRGDHWAIETSAGKRLARHVVIATGRDRQPFIPEWKGMRDFAGRIIHSADFGDAKDYAGKKVLVVGAGNSGIDALNHLAQASTASLWLSARNGPSVLPKRIGKIAVHRLSPLMARLPLRVADAVIALTQRLVFGDLTKFGVPPAPVGGASRLTTDYTAIAADEGAIDAIRSGRITVVPAVREFTRDGVILANGSLIDPDIVIAATGYRTGLEQMVGDLGVLDGKGVPLFNGGDADPKLPGLWFTGMRPSIRGCFANAAIQAKAIAERIARRIANSGP